MHAFVVLASDLSDLSDLSGFLGLSDLSERVVASVEFAGIGQGWLSLAVVVVALVVTAARALVATRERSVAAGASGADRRWVDRAVRYLDRSAEARLRRRRPIQTDSEGPEQAGPEQAGPEQAGPPAQCPASSPRPTV